jgi:signal transduction histidine kinase/ligand-binding sensor domain-containing protein
MKRISLLYLFSICCGGVVGQKSLFVTYNVEHGLGQSQATGLAQDAFHNLWISHLGGISRFDGKRFTTYTTADGLQSNFCNTLLVDATGNVWVGTHTGLSVYNGRSFKNFSLSQGDHPAVVLSVQCDRYNRVWALAEGELYTADINQCQKANLPFGNKRILAIGLDAAKEIMVAVEGASIFGLKGNEWKLLHRLDFVTGAGLKLRGLYTGPSGTLYFLSNKGVFVNNHKGWQPLTFNTGGQVQVFNLVEDEQKRIWLATTKGVYLLSGAEAVHLDTKKGFTDHTVYSILKDTEGNFWFSTIGSGIIKYYDGRVLYFDKELLANIGVSGITKTSDGTIWFGTYGGGLRGYDGRSLKTYLLPAPLPASQIINFCLADKNDVLWIGTQGGGLWYFKNGIFHEIPSAPPIDNKDFFSGHADTSGRVIVATYKGVYECTGGKLQSVGGEKLFANTAAFIGNDSILVGTPQGPHLLHNKIKKSFPSNNQLASASIISILRRHNNIFIGSADKGLFIVSLLTSTVRQYDMRSGLSSNCIYDIGIDERQGIWLSTGNYLDHLTINAQGDVEQVEQIGKSKGMLSPEGNTNSLLVTDSVVWVGNLGGLNRIALDEARPVSAPLKVMLTDVRLFSAPLAPGAYTDSIRRYYPVPEGLRLPHNKNHLTFSFHAVWLTDPDKVLYQYRIKGLEHEFSAPTANNQVVYSSLPPGNHLLQVKAVNMQGGQSPVMEYAFTIMAPFYQLWYFQLLFVLLGLGLAALLLHLRYRLKEKRKKEKEEIKREEQLLVRRRTAEDFHDDIGNKLTRINVLTEVLKNKVQVNEDAKNLIEQIQENTTGLYSSSKDLIWSLGNDNGSLHDLYARLVHFGKSLFQNTEIVFEYGDETDAHHGLQVAPETAHNVTLMVKEAMNNALKHSGATRVDLNISLNRERVRLTVCDNGKGFAYAQAAGKGYGLNNMQSRSQRIGASVSVQPGRHNGVTVAIEFSLTKDN